MNTLNKVAGIVLLASFGLAACGQLVEVPPATVGKILSSKGYEGKYIPPSKFRLPVCFIEPCPQVILISASDRLLTESMDLFLPKSRLMLKDLEVNINVSISTEVKDLDRILARVPTVRVAGRDNKYITFASVYRTYAKERIRATVRQLVAGKELQWLLSNRDVFSKTVHAAVNKSLADSDSPIVVKTLSFAKLNPPKIIEDALKKAEERKIAVSQAEANKAVRIKIAEADLEVAKKMAAVKLEKAKADLAVAVKMAVAATPQWLAFRRLEVLEEMAKNKNVVFFPVEMGSGFAVNVSALQELKKINANK